MNLTDLIETWILSGNSDSTRTAREADAKLLVSYLGSDELSAFTPPMLMGFVEHRLGAGDSPRTVSRRCAHVKSLCRVISDYNPTWVNVSRYVKAPDFEKKAVDGITHEDAYALTKAAYRVGRSAFDKLRSGTAVTTLLETGLRAAELMSLRTSNLSADGEWLVNLRRKGGKFRDAPIPPTLTKPLRAYLVAREQWLIAHLAPAGDYPLFLNTVRVTTKVNSIQWLWRVVDAAAERAYIKHVHPHQLRHTFALGLYDETKDIRLVAEALGHASVTTTMGYLTLRKEERARKIADAQLRVHQARARTVGESRLAEVPRGAHGEAHGGHRQRQGQGAAQHLEEHLLPEPILELQHANFAHSLRPGEQADAAQAELESRRHADAREGAYQGDRLDCPRC